MKSVKGNCYAETIYTFPSLRLEALKDISGARVPFATDSLRRVVSPIQQFSEVKTEQEVEFPPNSLT